MRAEDEAFAGESDVNEQELFSTWHTPRFSLGLDAWLVESSAGNITGDAWIWDEAPHEELLADVHVDPDEPHRNEIRAHLLAHVVARAREHAVQARGGRALLGIEVEDANEEKLALLRRHGFAPTRRYHRMLIDLRAGFARPVWPAGIDVREFRRGRDETLVHAALEEAFAEHHRAASMAREDWERRIFAHGGLDTSLWLVAWDGPEVAGTCLSFAYPERGYVEDLAVRRPWRGRGLGLALLLESFTRLEARGGTEVPLGVDSENETGALALYERAGMHVSRSQLFMEKENLES